MPTYNYPGVYIEEIPSGVRTIVGVATSITAFFGRALRGPDDTAVLINSYGDFERIFGGLWVKSTLGYAVRDFYLNGGSQAIVVRLYTPEAEKDADGKEKKDADGKTIYKRSEAKLTIGGDTGIKLKAASKGKWGENLRATIDNNVSEDVAKQMGLNKADLFNLTVRDLSPGGVIEQFRNLSLVDGPRRIDKVLASESKLVLWDGEYPSNPPAVPTLDSDNTKSDSVTIDEKAELKAVADAEKSLSDLKKASTPDAAAIKAAETALATAKAAVGNAARALGISDGQNLTASNFFPDQAEAQKKGLYALEQADLFNLLCIPPYLSMGGVDADLIDKAAAYCEKRRAFLIVDPPTSWISKEDARTKVDAVGTRSDHAAVFFPRLKQPNPLRDNQLEDFAPCGAIAGVFARTDAQRGVWKAPAGLDATLVGVPQLSVSLTDNENGDLNPLGVNCLRTFPGVGRIVWGSRTLRGDDRLASEWKYIPVRRLALYLEESLYRGTQWIVFEPNDEPLWAQIRLNIGAFMNNLFRQGAFQGSTPREAYFVKCDKETTTQNDINLGIVRIVVGFAPLKPAEFVILRFQQMAGQIAV